MAYYKILLVDDEEEIRLGIKQKIAWEQLGFQVVGDAENGEDAMEKIALLEPDLVMTDIKMPYMDGLELAKHIRQSYADTEIVMFSGFDEFEYAKQAISLNVMEYILKPVNVEELTEILRKLKLKLDRKVADKRDIEALRLNYLHMLPVLKEHFLTDLIHGKLDKDTIAEGFLQYASELQGVSKWVVASVYIEIPRDATGPDILSLHQEKELVPISVLQVLEENLNRKYHYTTLRTSLGICTICGLSEEDTLSELVDTMNLVCKECKKILEVSVTIGIGEPYPELEKISDSYLESRDAIGYRASIGSDIAICIRDMENVQREYLQFDERAEGTLISTLKFGDQSSIEQMVEKLVAGMEDSRAHMREQQVYMISIVNSIMQFVQKYELESDTILGKNKDYLEVITGLTNLDSTQKWLTQVCITINRCMNQERTNTAKTIIEDAKTYILEHFANQELSVEMVCEHLHISQAYFSTIFKKETGVSYVNYLTDIRLNKAVELLNETEDKTYIIADKVGYTEPNYFSYVFKKKFGISPSKYRGK
ncbi:MAG: response regulator [Lachnospiraceae bacterium]